MNEQQALHSWLTGARHSFLWHLINNEGQTEAEAEKLVASCINAVSPAPVAEGAQQ